MKGIIAFLIFAISLAGVCFAQEATVGVKVVPGEVAANFGQGLKPGEVVSSFGPELKVGEVASSFGNCD